MIPRKRVLLSWSSGKDCAWVLHVLRWQEDVEVVGLLSSFNEAADRVSMHAVRRELAQSQADAAGLPLWPVLLPWPCSNEAYEDRMQQAIDRARQNGVTHVAFGDLFLNDIREYRIRQRHRAARRFRLRGCCAGRAYGDGRIRVRAVLFTRNLGNDKLLRVRLLLKIHLTEH